MEKIGWSKEEAVDRLVLFTQGTVEKILLAKVEKVNKGEDDKVKEIRG